jgi:phage gp36-like protein
MAYASGSDMVVRYDVRRLGQWLSDSDTPVADADVPGNATLAALLADASEMLNSAAFVGKRYSRANLTALASADGGPFLKRIVCDLAFGMLAARRGYSARELDELAPNWQWAQQQLELLRLGERIFDFTANAGAGLAQVVSVTDQSGSLLSKNVRLFGVTNLNRAANPGSRNWG